MPEFAYSFNYAAAIRLTKQQGKLIKIEWDKIAYPTTAKLFIFHYNGRAENVAKKRRILFASLMLTEKKFHNKRHTMTMLAFFNIKIETFHVFFLVLFKKSRNKKVLSNLCDLFWLLSIQCQNFAIFFFQL